MPNVSLNSPAASPNLGTRARMTPPSSPPTRVRSPGIPSLTIRPPSSAGLPPSLTASRSSTSTTASANTASTTSTAGAHTYMVPYAASPSPSAHHSHSLSHSLSHSHSHPNSHSHSHSPNIHTTRTPSHSTTTTQSSALVTPLTPTASWPSSSGLLVPTDRTLDDLEENWLPRLGVKLRVEREVRVPGYALYGIRSWYLSRRHWPFTIAAATGKPTDTISCYVIVPAADLPESAGTAELTKVTQRLAREVNGVPRKTESGTLLVSLPAAYRQELSPIQTGDMREAWPFIVLNTALRRLGCGGRAAMGNEFPVPAVRRKFYELYRITTPKGAENEGMTGPQSPPASPTSHGSSPGHGHFSTSPTASNMSSQPSAEMVANSTILINVVELVKLLQGALTLWGMYGSDSDEFEMDGLFCDETKAGLFEWRRVMGMESDDGFKLAKETSGGCIDPRTLSALLSSVTSVRYQLAVLGVEKLPKDPFGSPRKFLNAWRVYQASLGSKNGSDYLSVSSIRILNGCYVSGRSRTHASDALKVHRILLSGVATATSNLRGNTVDDSSTPLRKREQHKRFRGDEDDDSGIGMIVPDGNGNTVAAPDVITTDLEAYRKLSEKAREKEWDTMGARRVAELWSGATADKGPEGDVGRHHGRLQAFRRRVTQTNGIDTDDDNSPSSAIGAFKGMRDRTGAALKGGFGLVGRRHGTLNYDTSDSEGPSRTRRKAQSVPLVIEPDGDDQSQNHNQKEHNTSTVVSRSPSPSTQFRNMSSPLTSSTRHSNYPTITSPLQQSVHLGAANLAGDLSDVSVGGARSISSPLDRSRSLVSATSANANPYVMQTLPLVQGPDRRLPPDITPKLLRTLSGPPGSAPDAKATQGPATASPLGLGLGLYPGQKYSTAEFGAGTPSLRRTKSYTHAEQYRGVRRKAPQHLVIDVAMCEVVWELRRKERELAKRAADMQILERSALTASQAVFDARDLRLTRVAALEVEAAQLVDELQAAASTGVEDDATLHRAASNIQFFLSEDMNTNELTWGLHDLQKAWEGIGDEPRAAGKDGKSGKSWWAW